MPVSINHSMNGRTTFTYDGNNTRVKKAHGNTETFYFGPDFEIKKQGLSTDYIVYIFAGNLRVAKVSSQTGTFYFHKDHLGSSTAMTSSAGAEAETTEYLPFGSQRSHTGSTISDYKFTDQELDPESGLYNYKARLYDPVIGRFISPDPLVPNPYDPQHLNRYSYCYNNPLIYVDPTGHFAEMFIDYSMINWGSLMNLLDQTLQAFFDSDGYGGTFHATAFDNLIVDFFGPNTLSFNESTLGLDDPALGPSFGTITSGHKSCGVGACHGPGTSSRDSVQVYVQMSLQQGADPAIVTVANTYAMLGEMDAIAGACGHGVDAGGSKMICTELYRQGLMADKIYRADSDFGTNLMRNDPKVMIGYHYCATPIVSLMHKSRAFTNTVNLFAKPWSYEMAHRMGFRDKGSFIGRIIMSIGIPVCRIIGQILSLELKPRIQLSFFDFLFLFIRFAETKRIRMVIRKTL